jgi:hypothetical protein
MRWTRCRGWAIIGMLGVMVAVVSLQVLLRYAVNISLGFADELLAPDLRLVDLPRHPAGHTPAVLTSAWRLLSSRLPPKVQDVLARLMAAIAAAMMILVAWQSAVVRVRPVGRADGLDGSQRGLVHRRGRRRLRALGAASRCGSC